MLWVCACVLAWLIACISFTSVGGILCIFWIASQLALVYLRMEHELTCTTSCGMASFCLAHLTSLACKLQHEADL